MRLAPLLVLLALSPCASAGCAADPHGAASASSPLKAPGTAKIGDRTTCPVSGEVFVVTPDSPKVEIEGRTYYTCCPHCAEKLRENPRKFLPST